MKIFNARNNSKTLLIISLILLIIIFGILFFIPSSFVSQDKKLYYNFWGNHNFAYFWDQITNEMSEENKNAAKPLIFQFTMAFTFMFPIIVILFFIQLKLNNWQNKFLRVFVAVVILLVSINLLTNWTMITMYSAYIKHFMSDKKIQNSDNWGSDRLLKTKQALTFIISFIFVLLASWNLYIESKVKYAIREDNLKIDQKI